MVKNLSLREVSIYLRLLEDETVFIINFYAHVLVSKKAPLRLRGGVKELKQSPIPLPLYIKPLVACCEHSRQIL